MRDDFSDADREALYRVIDSIPAHVVPVAYLCVGYPREFLASPELERRGWATRLPLEDVVYHERWEGPRELRPRRSA